MSTEPFNSLVKLAARSFYDDLAVVILDALTRRLWVREEDLAKDLKMHNKKLRQILRFFEEEKLVARCHRKESAHRFSDAADGHGKEGKVHTRSYCCLDYSQIHDVVRYRHHRMKKKLKLDCRNTVQEYLCPGCNRRYNALDALHLISSTGEGFLCENCNGKLVAEGDDLAAKKLRDMLKQKMKKQLKPLKEQLKNVKDLTCPEYGTLQAWEARAFMGDPKVEVELSDAGMKEEDVKPEVGGMNLTEEEKVDGKTTIHDLTEDRKPKIGEMEEEKDIQVEYYKAYYEALMKMQQERDEAAKMNQQEPTSSENVLSDKPSDRRAGMKSKREEDDDDIEWEDAPTTGTATEHYKLHNLNVPVENQGRMG
ncbi:hypothetical protein MKW98_028188 [Papaver atlanticum]|uniref:HTH TFE/IIEalpha-type domain-containing protein n=1 Tax=Papaver atlanticum TaxID=357466 RepID=A0AAD4XMC3_9MAGN|nr:hypothetical protein MKW98_028188 [Papaver atlanticum]